MGSSRRAHQFHASLVAPSQILLELRSDEVVDEGRWFGTQVIFTLVCEVQYRYHMYVIDPENLPVI